MFENAPVKFDCPKCGHQIEETIGWLTTHSEMTCPGCSVTIKLDTDDLSRGMEDIQKAFDSIPKQINIKF